MTPQPPEQMPWDTLVKVPSVDRDDHLVAQLTARQAAQLAATVGGLWLAWRATCGFLPPLVFLAAAAPVLAAAIAVVLTRRDGLPLDRWLRAAWHHHRSPHQLLPAAPADGTAASGQHPARGALAALPLPAEGLAEDGTVTLAGEGACALTAAGTVNFALRTPGEQQALIGAYSRWLNALTGPVQILVRCQRLDLSPHIAALRDQAPELPHPLLEDAAVEHASFLADLADERDLLTRQVLVVHREPGGGPGASQRLQRRAADCAALLAAAEIAATVLDGAGAYAALTAACDPANPPHPGPALPHQPVTAPPCPGGRP